MPTRTLVGKHAALPAHKSPQRQQILAAQKIIADISSGVYRSPAAALKELVSNGYDADATRVVITTDPPHFRTIAIEDNGDGMSLEKFLDVITHIGGSSKRMGTEVSPRFHRPLIGRIGIGMLAIAQIGNRFFVSSSVKGQPYRFVAEVNLEPFHKDDAALHTMGTDGDEKVEIGAVQYVSNIPEDAAAHYTVITVPNAKKGLTSEITSLVRDSVGATEVLDIHKTQVRSFRDIVDVVQSSSRADLALDGYYFMVWELGLLCPVNYLPGGPIKRTTRRVENVDGVKVPRIEHFKVEVDGIEVFRPQLFPNPFMSDYAGPDPKAYSMSFTRKVSGRPLEFSGYVYAQQPRTSPEELRGVHIRIRNVGIGKYDKSWLGYPFNEGLKFGQLTGEIFVTQGLEPALNIDRDSFRETDVHYQALKAYLWERLKTEIFPEFKSRQKANRLSKEARTTQRLDRAFINALRDMPAPMFRTPRLVNKPGCSLLEVIKSSRRALNVERTAFNKLTKDLGIRATDEQQRLIKVLSVLASSELLFDLAEDDFQVLVRALALAVR